MKQNIKKFTLIEGVITILLFAVVLGLLRYIIFDSNIYASSIKYNTSQIVKMQNMFIVMDKDLNYAYQVDINENEIIAQTPFERVIYTKTEDAFYRNKVKLIDLNNIDIDFYNYTTEINSDNGKTVIRLDISYNKKYKLEEKTVNFTKYITTQEEISF